MAIQLMETNIHMCNCLCALTVVFQTKPGAVVKRALRTGFAQEKLY